MALTCAAQSAQADIAAGSLTEVLARFANSAGAAISFDARQTAGRSSPGLQGEYGVDEGFARILQGSGLQAERQANGTYVLRTLAPGSALELSPTRIDGQYSVVEADLSEDTLATLGFTLQKDRRSTSICGSTTSLRNRPGCMGQGASA